MDGDVVDGGVDAAGEALLGTKDRLGAHTGEISHRVVVEFAGGHAGESELREFGKEPGGRPVGAP
jgi:hypothetical protein